MAHRPAVNARTMLTVRYIELVEVWAYRLVAMKGYSELLQYNGLSSGRNSRLEIKRQSDIQKYYFNNQQWVMTMILMPLS